MFKGCRGIPVVLLICAIAFLWLPALRAGAEVQPNKEFAAELEQSGLELDPAPFSEFSVTRVLTNVEFEYSFALKHRTLPLEVRFAIRHLPADVKTRPGPEPTFENLHDAGQPAATIHLSQSNLDIEAEVTVPVDVEQYFEVSVMNMAADNGNGPRMAEPEPFDTDAVKAEFNADWGAVSKFVPRRTFAKYKSGLVYAIYRDDNKALGYCIVLYSGKMSGKMRDVFNKIFHAMRFRSVAE